MFLMHLKGMCISQLLYVCLFYVELFNHNVQVSCVFYYLSACYISYWEKSVKISSMFVRFSVSPFKSINFLYLYFCFCFFLFCFVFLGPHPWQMEVPWPGVESGLQLLCQIHAVSATYTTVYSNAGSLTQWVGPGIKPVSSWILAGFVTVEPLWELLMFIFWS